MEYFSNEIFESYSAKKDGYGFIYKVTNTINGKVYIGKTIHTIHSRWRDHKKASEAANSRAKIYNAIRKYGFVNFTIEQIEQVPIENLNEREVYWINFYDSQRKGYNITRGGDGGCQGHIAFRDVIESWDKGLSATEIAQKYNVPYYSVFTQLHNYTKYTKSEGRKRSSKDWHYKVEEKLKKPIIQYDMNGNYLYHYRSLTEAAEATNLSIESISARVHNNISFLERYRFSFEHDQLKMLPSKYKRIAQYSQDGCYICSYPRTYLINYNLLGLKLNGRPDFKKLIYFMEQKKHDSVFGYTWKYIEEEEKMELLDFINLNFNWKDIIAPSPYNIKIKEEDDYIMLNYNQLNSDFSLPLVRQCRGIIIKQTEEGYWKIVCRGFDRFFNYGEPYAADIDWSSARVQEKIDGSIMKVWYDNGSWRLSTNGSINAYKTELNTNELLKINCSYSTFGDLFDNAINRGKIPFEDMDKDCTYMFELVSPYNKVVIDYPEIILNHIGTRNNITGEELNVDIGIRKPKEYPIHSLEDCVRCASELSKDEEGYVVVDKYWKRIKVKNPVYLQLHRMISNNQLNMKDILQMIFENEQEEFLSYFPEYRGTFENIVSTLDQMKERFKKNYNSIMISIGPFSQKEFALKVMEVDKSNSDYYFQHQKRGLEFEDWVKNMPKDKLIEKLKK